MVVMKMMNNDCGTCAHMVSEEALCASC